MDVITLCYERESLAHATTIVKTMGLEAEKARSKPTADELREQHLQHYRAAAMKYGIAAE